MSKRDVVLLLEDILESIEKIQSYAGGLDFMTFSSDPKTVDAVVRNFEIIGEASKQLPYEWKSSCSEIEWHKLAGIRNRIIHEYFGVDLTIIWKIIFDNLPKLKVSVEKIISSNNP